MVTVTVTNKSRTTGTCHHVSFLAWYGQSGRGYLPLALPPRARWSCAEGRGVGVRPLGVLVGGLGRCGRVMHGVRSCAAGYLVSVALSLSSFVRLPRSCRSRAAPLLAMSPPLIAPPPPRVPPSAALPFRSGVRVRLPAPTPSASSACPVPRAVAPLSPCISCLFCARLAARSQLCPCTAPPCASFHAVSSRRSC